MLSQVWDVNMKGRKIILWYGSYLTPRLKYTGVFPANKPRDAARAIIDHRTDNKVSMFKSEWLLLVSIFRSLEGLWQFLTVGNTEQTMVSPQGKRRKDKVGW